MARKFHRKETLSAVSEINVTPLIDLAFALLIIFMITTPLLEQTIAINLPLESASPQEDRRDRFQGISIDREGDYFWGDELVSLHELQQRLEVIGMEADPPILNIRADASLPYQQVIRLMDLIKQANLSRISLDTRVD
jgi:biopolymer transport protein ExbD